MLWLFLKTNPSREKIKMLLFFFFNVVKIFGVLTIEVPQCNRSPGPWTREVICRLSVLRSFVRSFVWLKISDWKTKSAKGNTWLNKENFSPPPELLVILMVLFVGIYLMAYLKKKALSKKLWPNWFQRKQGERMWGLAQVTGHKKGLYYVLF